MVVFQEKYHNFIFELSFISLAMLKMIQNSPDSAFFDVSYQSRLPFGNSPMLSLVRMSGVSYCLKFSLSGYTQS